MLPTTVSLEARSTKYSSSRPFSIMAIRHSSLVISFTSMIRSLGVGPLVASGRAMLIRRPRLWPFLPLRPDFDLSPWLRRVFFFSPLSSELLVSSLDSSEPFPEDAFFFAVFLEAPRLEPLFLEELLEEGVSSFWRCGAFLVDLLGGGFFEAVFLPAVFFVASLDAVSVAS